MRNCLYLLLAFSLPATAAVPSHLADPALDARLQALLPRFEALNKDREVMTRQPGTTATWTCPVQGTDLLRLSGAYLEGMAETSRLNAGRQGVPPLATRDIVFVPLEGSCKNGRLEGRVAFWARFDQEVSDRSFAVQFGSRIYQRVALTLGDDGVATDLQVESLNLTTSSKNPYLKASSDPRDGTLVVMWSSVANDYRSAPGQSSVSLLAAARAAPMLVTRQEARAGTVFTLVFSEATAAPTTIRDRYDATGTLVERDIGGMMRHYVAADGSWKSEMLKGPGAVASAPAAPARPAAAGGPGNDFNRIDGNTGRYLSPITRKGLPAAWVGRASDGNGIGTTVGGMAGSYVGEKALQQVPFVGGFLGRKAGEAAARKMAQQAAGGDAYMRETSDLSFNSIDDMAGFLATHATDPGFDVVLKAATKVYPELNDAYLRALRAR